MTSAVSGPSQTNGYSPVLFSPKNESGGDSSNRPSSEQSSRSLTLSERSVKSLTGLNG